MTTAFNELTIRDIVGLTGRTYYDTMPDDFFIAKVSLLDTDRILKYPCKLDAFAVFFCLKGNVSVDINLKSYDIKEDTLFLYTPGNTIKIKHKHGQESQSVEFVIAAASREFLRGVNMRASQVFKEGLSLMDNPCLHINEDEKKILNDYYVLASDLYELDHMATKDAIRAIGTSIIKLYDSMWYSRMAGISADQGQRKPKNIAVYEQFLMLVGENYAKEHETKFYADRLCLTPKYLSKLVKEVGGRTVPEWISALILLDVQNLLRYSDYSIKEIAYKLNFSGVPAFHKFFKTQTGMTPMEYRNQ